ncbi:hypothetical protein [Halospeciosus flavus]|uniref:hypothetical protein n=1 Tax=Halospeciosus flavus TaxID=3032283 RepID=UPI00360BFB29
MTAGRLLSWERTSGASAAATARSVLTTERLVVSGAKAANSPPVSVVSKGFPADDPCHTSEPFPVREAPVGTRVGT